jgi:protein-S-isoprenylcysteine O-methyltransferase Ste14
VAGAAGVLTGVAISFWAVRTAADTDLADPDQLATGGPYSLTRHPMYVAWTVIYVGVAALAGSRWLFRLLPLLLALVHLTAIHEERRLARRFGPEYRDYAMRVPRYLGARSVTGLGGRPGSRHRTAVTPSTGMLVSKQIRESDLLP